MKTKFISDCPAEAEDSAFLHSVQLAPKFGVISEIVQTELWFIEIGPERKNAQLHIGRAERAGGQSVKPELDRVAPNKLLSNLCDARLGRSSGDAERPHVAGFVINDPERVIGESASRFFLRKDQIDAAADTKFFSDCERHLLRVELPFSR